MIRIQTATGSLDLAAGAIGIECLNPFFSFDTVPGTQSYPFSVPLTAANQVQLNFPHVRAAQGEPPAPEPVLFFIDEVLWRVGSLVYEGCDLESELPTWQYSFVADASDLQARIEGLTLPALELGTVPFSPYLLDDYALPCVRNTAFYGEKDTHPGYNGILNYFQGLSYTLGPFVPFLRLVPLLRRVLGAVGYSLAGSWLLEPEAQQLLVYSDRRHDAGQGTLQVNRHVPEMGVSEFLLALQKFLGLGYAFNPVRRELRITSLRDVLAQPEYTDRVGGLPRSTAADSGGYTLKMGLESDDALNKTLDTSWAQLRVGAGKTSLDTSCGTLHVVREPDPAQPGRSWLVPAVEAPGATTELGGTDESKCGLRLLYDWGLQPDSQGNLYPLASSAGETYAGQVLAAQSLHWPGAEGLYARRHQAWLEFLGRSGPEERTMQFGVADLLSLEPARKEMVASRKYLWQKVSLSLPVDRPLQQARFTYRNVRL